MNITLLPQYLIETLGWTLIHWLWQGVAVAIILAVLLKGFAKISANRRYLIGCAGLAVLTAMPMLTFKVLSSHWEKPTKVATAEIKQADITHAGTIEMPLVENVAAVVEEAVVEPVIKISFTERVSSFIETNSGFIVYGWLIGVFGFCLWHLGGWRQLQKLRRTMVKPVGEKLVNKMNKLSCTIGVKRVVSLMESALVGGPMVVGWLKPVILLPGSALTGLAPEQLEAILAHELAHIKRCDYLVNIIQTAVEIVGFYNPAIWWVSAKIREERENCCDDIAVALTGDKVSYVRALTMMEEVRCGYKLAVAGSGGSLFGRVKRLLTKDRDLSGEKSLLTAAVAVLLLVMVAIPAGFAMSSKADEKADSTSKSENSDYKVTLDSGVTVELVGVCDYPQDRPRSWWPDGSRLKKQVYATKWNKKNPKPGEFGFIFKLDGPEDLSFSWNKIKGSESLEGSCQVVDYQGNILSGFEAAIAFFRNESSKTSLRVGIATGPWNKVASHDGNGMCMTQGIAFATAYEFDGAVRIVVTDGLGNDVVQRIIAIDENGNIHTCKGSSGSVSNQNLRQTTANFPGLNLKQIKEFQFQTRPYEWVDFKNVSLKPGNKADVQVDKVETNTAIDIRPDDFKLRYDSKKAVYNLVVSINNDSDAVMPEFNLRYYRGDAAKNNDETGNPHSGWHNAGPIDPGKQWNERTRGFNLPDGEYEFSVVLDYDNAITESDENNNVASIKVAIKDGQIVEDGVADIEEKNDARQQILTRARILSVPADLPQLKDVLSEDKSKGIMITPEELEEFIKVVNNTSGARTITMPTVIANDGEVTDVRTDNAEGFESVKLNIKNTVAANRDMVKLEFDFVCDVKTVDGYKTSNVVSTATLLSGNAIAADGGIDERGNKIVLIVQPKIMEAGDWQTGIIERASAKKQIIEFKAKLEQPVTVDIDESPDGSVLTVQYAVIAICKAADVPYNWDKSAQLADPQRRKFVDPLALKNKIASQAILDMTSLAGLAYGVDAGGVYLYKPEKVSDVQSNIEVIDVELEPVVQGKNAFYVTVQNKSDAKQIFGVHIYTRSVDYGPDGVGWGTGFFETFEPNEKKRVKFVYKIHGPVTENTYLRLKFYNPETQEQCDGDKPFAVHLFEGSDLPKPEKALVMQDADKEIADEILKAFKDVQSFIEKKDYELAWGLFSEDYQKSEYQRKGYEAFKLQMEPEHELDAAFHWDKETFVALESKSICTLNDRGVELKAEYKDKKWTIYFVRDSKDDKWKIDDIVGYKMKVLEIQEQDEANKKTGDKS